jgi:hypothetical protein
MISFCRKNAGECAKVALIQGDKVALIQGVIIFSK